MTRFETFKPFLFPTPAPCKSYAVTKFIVSVVIYFHVAIGSSHVG